jgi:hypothetical protein
MSNNKQSSLDKDFVPYEEAVALKELGFDEPCFAVYFNTTQQLYFDKYINEFNKEVRTLAPTFQQAFRWFREKYQVSPSIHCMSEQGNSWRYHIPNEGGEKDLNTYEEAELECLRKLIEIVQGGNK